MADKIQDSYQSYQLFRWPARIKPGIIDRDFAHVVDLPATFLDLAGAPDHRRLERTGGRKGGDEFVREGGGRVHG